jgi:hypothetical protein
VDVAKGRLACAVADLQCMTMKKNESNRGKPDERTEIRETTHRVMGSRQSQKSVERSGQRRQPKTGGTGGHGKSSQS